MNTLLFNSPEKNIGTTERAISVAAGTAIVVNGLMGRSFSPASLLKILAGGFLIYRGAGGYCPLNSVIGRNTAESSGHVLVIEERIQVNRKRQEVYEFWRKLENLPKFMKHLEKVEVLSNTRSHWEAKIPGGIGTLKWEAEVTSEMFGRRLAWTSVDDAVINNSGEVFFRDIASQTATEVRAIIIYSPPAGDTGATVAKLLNGVFGNMIRKDLQRFKEIMEAGEEE